MMTRTVAIQRDVVTADDFILDKLPKLRRHAIEALRPLEEGVI